MFLLRVTRDSVCMGDDCTAPNARMIAVEPFWTLQQQIEHIVHEFPLASVHGGNVTWAMMIDDVRVAVMAQEWKRPHILRDDIQIAESVTVHFHYYSRMHPKDACKLFTDHPDVTINWRGEIQWPETGDSD